MKVQTMALLAVSFLLSCSAFAGGGSSEPSTLSCIGPKLSFAEATQQPDIVGRISSIEQQGYMIQNTTNDPSNICTLHIDYVKGSGERLYARIWRTSWTTFIYEGEYVQH